MIPPDRTVLLSPLLIAGSVTAACLAVTIGRLPPLVRVMVPAAVAFAVAQPLLARAVAAERQKSASSIGHASKAEAHATARAAALAERASQLRHDLRGILSPAMLTADRLTTSQDPVARRAAEAMISTVERAEERLRRDQGQESGPDRRLGGGGG